MASSSPKVVKVTTLFIVGAALLLVFICTMHKSESSTTFIGAVVASPAPLVNQQATIPPTVLYAVPITGIYHVTWTAGITQSASTSSVLGGTNGFQLQYFDCNNGQFKQTAVPITNASNIIVTAITSTFGVCAKAGTNISYLMDYTSVGGTPMQYDLSMRAVHEGP